MIGGATATLDTGMPTTGVQLLGFLRDWLAADADQLVRSLAGYVGHRRT